MLSFLSCCSPSSPRDYQPITDQTSKSTGCIRKTYPAPITNPLFELFSEDRITVNGQIINYPTKAEVANLIEKRLRVNTEWINNFLQQHATVILSATFRSSVETKLFDRWKNNPSFSYREAQAEVKNILGEHATDDDVIFMLYMLCTTNSRSKGFEDRFARFELYFDHTSDLPLYTDTHHFTGG